MATADALRLLQQYLTPYAMTPPPQPQRAAAGLPYEGEGLTTAPPDLLQALTGEGSPSPMAPMPPGLMESLPKSVQDSLRNRRSYSEQQSQFMAAPSYGFTPGGADQEMLTQQPHSREQLAAQIDQQQFPFPYPMAENEVHRRVFQEYPEGRYPSPLNSMMGYLPGMALY